MGANSSKKDDTPQQNRRPLFFDPRSPTEGITRTPIMVDVTPMQALQTPTSKITQLVDPRSPAECFKRTPVLTPMKFDFAELEQALQEQLKQNQTPVASKAVAEEAPTPPSTPLKAKAPKAVTPLGVRSPNVNVTGDSRAGGKEIEVKHTPSAKSRLRHVAHQNQAKKRGVVQDENSPRPIRL
ncbi:cell division cycle-associated protein 3 [Galendromus occidentalis]|uniref:Cell division cycle-associated protein 3 n=1 Tax=Galendromus occidentalis TaxID=34638 RepID=A0AAJ6VWF4_9ACAR|nr:cell division cycle-associated protein 3 [Galendromus occidentalis]